MDQQQTLKAESMMCMITGCERTQNGDLQLSQQQAVLAALKECSRTRNLERGEKIHAEAVQYRHESNIYIANSLINMYARCGSIVNAQKVFDSIKEATVVSWNVLILGYAENGQSHMALDVFVRMRNEGPAPNSGTLVGALKACTSFAVKGGSYWLDRGREIHNFAMENFYHSDFYVESTLVDMYAKCGRMIQAREVFDCMKHPTVVSWTALIMGYADNGQGYIALDMFTRMRIEAPPPNSVTLIAAIKACTSLGAEECKQRGKQVHNFAVENSYNADDYVQSTLLDMYAKSGSMVDAHQVFGSLKHPDVVTWTALILGYAEIGQSQTSLDLFARMIMEGLVPDYVTFVAALKACTSLAVIEGKSRWIECRDKGKQIHNLAVQKGCDSHIYVQSTLEDMYAKCGCMVDAREVFDSMKHPTVVSWNVLILGYADNGQGYTALDLFTRMKSEGPAPDSATLVAAVVACTSLALKEGSSQWAECRVKGKQIHNVAVENGCTSEMFVQNSLMDMYAKYNSMADAYEVFESMKHADVVSWNSLILGYAETGQGQRALDLFTRMKTEGPSPNFITFEASLIACGLVGALEFGRRIHSEFDMRQEFDAVLVKCLVDFYAKCGSLVEARRVFDLYSEARDTTTWNALLAGMSSCGDTESVFELYLRMKDAGFRPDGITFLSILSCCSHAGLVVKGKECFDEMCTKYGISPSVKHYTCMIDLLGRANKLDDAMGLLESMPCSPDDVTWMSVLSACCKWKNVEIGRLAFRCLIDLNVIDSSAYLLMGQIYASKGMLHEHRMLMKLQKSLANANEI